VAAGERIHPGALLPRRHHLAEDLADGEAFETHRLSHSGLTPEVVGIARAT
jgi:hypothetical protein